VLTESAKKRKAHLESECRRLEERLRQLQQTTPDPNASIAFLRPDGSIYTSFSNRIHELQLQLAYYVSTADKQEERNLNELLIRAKRQAAEEALAEKRQRKRATEKALLAQAKSRSRDLADTVKKRLNRTENCPYCGGLLGNDPHADHIYPQSKGGLSVDANMVYVCAVCNGNKADMTLTAFIERFSLNRAMVEQRLRDLGKDF
jgi:5-methylcytosine-specific restriction endonuclease McrA